jgi:hypothetical protein
VALGVDEDEDGDWVDEVFEVLMSGAVSDPIQISS